MQVAEIIIAILILAGLVVLSAVFIKMVMTSTKHAKERSLYERLGGVYAIAAVVDYFSDRVVDNPLVGKDSPNPHLREWSRSNLTRLPGLKWMRTLWVCDVTGGPYKYIPTVPGRCPLSLEKAHEKLQISPAEFDEVAKELKLALEHFNVPAKETAEVLAAFAAHKGEVDQGWKIQQGQPPERVTCPFRKS